MSTTTQRSRRAADVGDQATIALRALAWILGDQHRAARILALTGLGADDLRGRIDDPVLHEAILAFLAANEADLLDCAEALGVAPRALVPPEPQA